METRKPQRCYTCGSLFQGASCPECRQAVDFRDMDMRVSDCVRLLLLLLREVVVRAAARRAGRRSAVSRPRCGSLPSTGHRAAGGCLSPQRT